MRMIRDGEHGMVVVYELDPSLADSGPRMLVFESQGSRVRVANYPTDWRRLSENDLLSLRRATESPPSS
jgi:hypothetical protein